MPVARFAELAGRRLPRAGFVQVDSASPVTQVAAIAGLWDSLIARSSPLFGFPDLNHPPATVHTILLAGIASRDRAADDSIVHFADAVVEHVKPLLKTFTTATALRFRVFVTHTALSASDRRSYTRKKRVHVAYSWRGQLRAIRVELVPVDLATASAKSIARNMEPDAEIVAALAQLEAAVEKTTSSNVVRNYMALLLERPVRILREHTAFYGLLMQPDVLAYRIVERRLAAKQLFGAVVASSGLAAILANALGVDGLKVFATGHPIPDQMLDGLFFMIAYLFVAALTHVPLRLIGGRGDFQSTFLATTFISAMGYPILVLMQGLPMKLGASASDVQQASGYGLSTITTYVLAAVHQLSRKRALVALFVIVPLAILLVASVIGAGLFFLGGP